MDSNEILAETLKSCLQDVSQTEKVFIIFCLIALSSFFLLSLARQQQTIQIPMLGKIPSAAILKKAFFIKLFLIFTVLYSLCDWMLAILRLGRHRLYDHLTHERTLLVLLADKWDTFVSCGYLQVMFILDIIQNILFLFTFILIFVLFFRK